MQAQVYLPVAVLVDTDTGELLEAVIDFEGAPWGFVDDGYNVWVEDEYGDGDWRTDTRIEMLAVKLFNDLLLASWT